MGDDTAPFFGTALGGIGRRVEGLHEWPITRATSGRPRQRPLEVTTGPSLLIGPVVMRVPCTPFGLRACPAVQPMHRALTMRALL
jgi:hypothetical protein